jgi:hypothetical protein
MFGVTTSRRRVPCAKRMLQAMGSVCNYLAASMQAHARDSSLSKVACPVPRGGDRKSTKHSNYRECPNSARRLDISCSSAVPRFNSVFVWSETAVAGGRREYDQYDPSRDPEVEGKV